MRELKFRVWDNKVNKYINPIDGRVLVMGEDEWGTGFALFPVSNINDETPRYTIEQFTGLQDSEGKDIYEGDVLRASNPDCNYLVEFINGVYLGVNGNMEANLGLMRKHFKIVGNVNENPELL